MEKQNKNMCKYIDYFNPDVLFYQTHIRIYVFEREKDTKILMNL